MRKIFKYPQRLNTRLTVVFFLFFLHIPCTYAQRLAVKTNLLYDATATINISAETYLAPKWSLDITGNYNAWDFKDYRKQKQWMVQPEGRFWFCETFNGHFLAAHLMTGEFNMANPFFPFSLYKPLREYRYEGVFYGAGVGYGYHFILSPRWSIEAEVGVGYMGTKYEQYACIKCGELVSEGYSNRFAITKLSLALVFIIF